MASSHATKNLVIWFDLPVTNLNRATKFYSEVLGVGIEIQEHEGTHLGIFDHNENSGGCLVEQPEVVSNDKGPLLYFNVNGRLKEAVAKVAPNGGTVVKDIHPLRQYGFRATILDPEGNQVFLHSRKND